MDVAKSLSTSKLFEPFTLKGVTLPNRIVMAPMGRLFATNGVMDARSGEYYARRARGGVGLIIGEAAGVDEKSQNKEEVSLFFGEERLDAWREIIARVREAGGLFMAQLHHAGRVRPTLEYQALGPSPWFVPLANSDLEPQPGFSNGEAATHAQIEAVIDSFASAAVKAKTFGCVGVNIHAAHGYLLDQFLWDRTNHRMDEFGRDEEGRRRIVIEVVQETRRRVGAEFPIFLRFSQWKTQDYSARLFDSPGKLAAFLEPLANAGVDLFDCSTRRIWEPEFPDSQLNLAGWVKKLTGLPSMAVGSVGLDSAFMGSSILNTNNTSAPAKIDSLIGQLERNEFDLVAVGRALIANADWPLLVRKGKYDKMRPYSRELLKTLE